MSILHTVSTVTGDLVETQGVCPDSKVHGANMGPIWGLQDPGGPHVGPMNFAIWLGITIYGIDLCFGYTSVLASKV